MRRRSAQIRLSPLQAPIFTPSGQEAPLACAHRPLFRLDHLSTLASDLPAGLLALSRAVEACGLEKSRSERVKLRVSRFNGCDVCVQAHLDLTRRLGVSGTALDLLTVWRGLPEAQTPYSPREQAALAWAEALSRPADADARAAAGATLSAAFSAVEMAHLTAAIGLIHAWNRIAGALELPPPAQDPVPDARPTTRQP